MTAVHLGLPSTRSASTIAERPDTPYLVDTYGRRATDLRVSLTDRCNLRCRYCMPEEGLPWLPKDEVLNTGELIRLITLAVQELGVTEVRFTGGEPLLRPDLATVVAALAALKQRPRMSITTNGLSLRRKAAELAEAGLDRVNVSLDSIRRDTYHRMTRRDRLGDVLAGLGAASRAGLAPVKINAVLLRGINDDQARELLDFCLENGYRLRFIEQMPLDAGRTWERRDMVTADEILHQLSRGYTLTPVPVPRGSAPAEEWLVDGGPQTIGVIASVTRPFCGNCDRTRLTADGQVRNCLFAQDEADLRGPMRAGATDTELAHRWQDVMWAKAPGHGIDSASFAPPARPMSAIGG
ncbi:GTP 3',8-cyclase MoaA [Haloechinothrix salitolerans]|uniref:GTP 3',8-cyclase n=1 Tax=Haloechinothrix salitolerans TaxID=926830 RepID=A0ABW2C903_9PSEU